MLRQLTRSPLWQGQAGFPVPGGAVVNTGHPRAKGLLGFWWPSTTGSHESHGTTAAVVSMQDLSPYRRHAVYNRGGDASALWTPGPPHVGFKITSGQNGRVQAPSYRDTDWDLQGDFTIMLRLRIDTMITADDSVRSFIGRGDGSAAGAKRWSWGYSTSSNIIYFRNHESGASDEFVNASVGNTLVEGTTYTFAMTRSSAKVHRYYVDAVEIGTAVTGTNALTIPTSKVLTWLYGSESFGWNTRGTFFWGKVWGRVLPPYEVRREHESPYEMVDWMYVRSASLISAEEAISLGAGAEMEVEATASTTGPCAQTFRGGTPSTLV